MSIWWLTRITQCLIFISDKQKQQPIAKVHLSRSACKVHARSVPPGLVSFRLPHQRPLKTSGHLYKTQVSVNKRRLNAQAERSPNYSRLIWLPRKRLTPSRYRGWRSFTGSIPISCANGLLMRSGSRCELRIHRLTLAQTSRTDICTGICQDSGLLMPI